jgi:hypothetical protein
VVTLEWANEFDGIEQNKLFCIKMTYLGILVSLETVSGYKRLKGRFNEEQYLDISVVGLYYNVDLWRKISIGNAIMLTVIGLCFQYI